ncbi:MAG: hypothetical protein KJO95_07605 [Gammaproteobacteria bacterium]|nr:hypothetical protein [Gammaproteobacteria bacterium]MBU2676585.1 hypothetical protein [Gammaproteobacteria bacterium]NNL50321.1 hypothetical protein [Woeseiaceae bacterium]
MGDIDTLNADFARKHPDAFANVLVRGEDTEINTVLNRLPPAVAVMVASRLPLSRMSDFLNVHEDAVGSWLADAPINDAITLLGRIPRERCLALVNSLADRERRRRFLQYLKYPSHSVGALVTDVPLKFAADVPAEKVLADLREIDTDTTGPAVVILSEGHYLGLLDVWKLYAGEAVTGPIRNYLVAVPPLHAETPVASAISDPSWLTYSWLPVIDHERRVLGGVSRARLFAATTRRTSGRRRSAGVLEALSKDMLYVSGKLLSRAWAGWK